jgi:hypothetical protein
MDVVYRTSDFALEATSATGATKNEALAGAFLAEIFEGFYAGR